MGPRCIPSLHIDLAAVRCDFGLDKSLTLLATTEAVTPHPQSYPTMPQDYAPSYKLQKLSFHNLTNILKNSNQKGHLVARYLCYWVRQERVKKAICAQKFSQRKKREPLATQNCF